MLVIRPSLMRMMTVSSRRTRNFSKLKHWSSLQIRCPGRARIFRTSRMKSPRRRRTFETHKTQSSRGTGRLKISRRKSAILRRYPTQTRTPLGIPKHQRSLEQQEIHSKDDEIRTLENQLAHRDHVVHTLEFAYENLEKSSEERIATLWDEIKAKDRELGELRNRFEKERLVWEPDTQHWAASSSSGKIKKEKQIKIKPEPMEY